MPRMRSSGCGSSRMTCGQVRRDSLELAAAQPLDLAHAEQRVLVDGVDVERVVLHEAARGAPNSGIRTLQHAELVHLDERLVDARSAAQDPTERSRSRAGRARGRRRAVGVLRG